MVKTSLLILLLSVMLRNRGCCYNLDVTPGAVTTIVINTTGSTQSPLLAGYQMLVSINDTSLNLLFGAPKFSMHAGNEQLANGSIIRCSANISKSRRNRDVIATPSTFTLDESNSTESIGTENGTETKTTATTPTAAPERSRPAWISEAKCEVVIDERDLQASQGLNHVSIADNIGYTLLGPDTDQNYTICAPGRQKSCSGDHFSTGACYRGRIPGTLQWFDWQEKDCFLHYLDVVFVVDSSGSILQSDFETMRKVMLDAVGSFGGVGDTTQIAILQYGDAKIRRPNYASKSRWHYRQPMHLGDCKTLACVKNRISTSMIHMRSANTYTALAIERAVKLDFANSVHKDISKKILVLITDGAANDYRNLKKSYQLTQANNITVYAIGVGTSPIVQQLKISANGGKSDKNVLTTTSYENLKGTLTNLTRTISVISGEGQIDEKVDERIENALFGFAGHRSSMTGITYLGAVGAYRQAGAVMKLEQAYERQRDMLQYSQMVGSLPNFTRNSYLGFALTTGNYDGGQLEYLTAGAPRFHLHGTVLVFPITPGQAFPEPYRITAHFCPTCEPNMAQLGSYFGASVLSADVNADGKDDLLVGAPLHIHEFYDEGRVFVYHSQASNSVAAWAAPSYHPLELNGANDIGGRFGLSMAAAGDLNNDGYNDVAISAPFADHHRGAVYIYHGSANGIEKTAHQRIAAKSWGQTDLWHFGSSMQGGYDLDGNQYPDLIVSAFESDAIVLLRTRSLATCNNTIGFTKPNIDILKCFPGKKHDCARIQACLYYYGKGVDSMLGMEYTIAIDAHLKRFEIVHPSVKSGAALLRVNVTLQARQRHCESFKIYAKYGIKNINAPVILNLTHSLFPHQSVTAISTMEADHDAKWVSANATFQKSCGADHICHYDLGVKTSIALPEVHSKSANLSLTDGNTLVVAADSVVVMNVNLSNTGEHAYGAQVIVTYSKELAWRQLRNMNSSNGHSACVHDFQNEISIGQNRGRILSYEHDAELVDVMLNDSWCHFEIVFSTSSLRISGNTENVSIQVVANTRLVSIDAQIRINGMQNDLNATDNSVNYSFPVKYRADIDSSKKSFQRELFFNFTATRIIRATSVEEIGGSTPDIVIEHEVSGKGYSRIPLSSISLSHPSIFQEERLLYLYKLECVETGKVKCTCNQSKVNPLQLSTGTTGAKQNAVFIVPSQKELKKTFFDCSEAKNANNSSCATVSCDIMRLDATDSILLRAYFRLWTQSLRLNQNISRVSFAMGIMYSTAKSPLIIDDLGRSPTVLKFKTITTARNYTIPPYVPSQTPTWLIYAIAAGGGTFLLLCIILIMWKAGFFQSSYRNKLDTEEQNGFGHQSQERNIYCEISPR